MTKKNTWGGKRPGAGRPKTGEGVTIAVYVPTKTAEETRRHAADRGESLSKYVTEALNRRNEKERPEYGVLESAAIFDGYIDMAKTEEDLIWIERRLKANYTGTEENRKRLRERIRAEKMMMRKRGNEDR